MSDPYLTDTYSTPPLELHLLRSPEVDHLVKVVDAEQEHGGLVEGAHGVDAVPEPVLDHIRQLRTRCNVIPSLKHLLQISALILI